MLASPSNVARSGEPMRLRKSRYALAGLLLAASAAAHERVYSLTDLGTLGGTRSRGLDINACGQVTGISSLKGDTIEHAFLYSHGKMTDLGTLGGSNSYGQGINDRGQVAGQSETGDGVFHAFLHSHGTMIDLGTLGGIGSDGEGIRALRWHSER